MLVEITDQINTLKSSPTQKDSPNPPELTNLLPDNSRDPTLGVQKSTKIGGMWTLKNYISSPIFYELLVNI